MTTHSSLKRTYAVKNRDDNTQTHVHAHTQYTYSLHYGCAFNISGISGCCCFYSSSGVTPNYFEVLHVNCSLKQCCVIAWLNATTHTHTHTQTHSHTHTHSLACSLSPSLSLTHIHTHPYTHTHTHTPTHTHTHTHSHACCVCMYTHTKTSFDHKITNLFDIYSLSKKQNKNKNNKTARPLGACTGHFIVAWTTWLTDYNGCIIVLLSFPMSAMETKK